MPEHTTVSKKVLSTTAPKQNTTFDSYLDAMSKRPAYIAKTWQIEWRNKLNAGSISDIIRGVRLKLK